MSLFRRFRQARVARPETRATEQRGRRGRALRVERLEDRRVLAAADLAAISGVVFKDVTGDGYSAGEEVGGALVELHFNGTVRTAHTDAAGRYRFDGLSAGNYVVQQPEQTVGAKHLKGGVSQLIVITPLDAAGEGGVEIDTFDQTTQSVAAYGSSIREAASSVAAPEALGGERDLFVQMTSAAGRLEILANETTVGQLDFGSLGSSTGMRRVTWDGVDGDGAALNPTGLGGVDLTAGGRMTAVDLNIGSDLGGTARMRIYTDATHYSEASFDVAANGGGPTQSLILPFSSFVAASGGAADFSHVGAVVFELDGIGNVDASLNSLGTIGPKVFSQDFANLEQIDISLTKIVDTADPNVGQQVTFTIAVANAGPDAATHVVVADVLPAGLTYVSSQATRGSYSSSTGQWTVGTVEAGGSQTLTLVARVDTAGKKTNIAEVVAHDQHDIDSTPGNGDPSEDDQAMAMFVPQLVDVWLTKTLDTTAATVGDEVTFTITVGNDGPSTATGVRVADVLPAGLTLVNALASRGSYSASTGQWNVGTLVDGGQETLALTVRVDTAGKKVNVAEVVAHDQRDIDSTPGNGDPSEDDQDMAMFTPEVIDLSLDKTVDNTSPTVGDLVTFRVTVSNAGPSTATGVEVSDALPAGLDLVDAQATRGAYSAATGIWTVGTVADGTSETLTVTARVSTTGKKVNTAEVWRADQHDVDSTPGNGVATEDDQDMVMFTPEVIDVSLTKTVDVTTPNLHDQVVFTVVVRNDGPADATGVRVTDLLPAGLGFVSAQEGRGGYVDSTGVWTVGTLLAGTSATLRITATVDTLGTKTNVAEVTAHDQFDIDSTPNNHLAGEDDQAQVQVVPNNQIDLVIDKSDSPDPVQAGGLLTYTIVVRNDGPAPATGVVVTDTMPNEITGVEGVTTTKGTANTSGKTVTVQVGDLAVGASVQVVIQARVSTAASGQILNTAIVQGNEQEVRTDNNRDDEPTLVNRPPSSIMGTVFLDKDKDGVQDPNETGIPGVLVSLTGTTNSGQAVQLSTTTDAAGDYKFANLEPGVYQVAETQPTKYKDGLESLGYSPLNPLQTFGVNDTNDVFRQIGLDGGVDLIEYNFAEILAAGVNKRNYLASS